jgi:hypothetical protein
MKGENYAIPPYSTADSIEPVLFRGPAAITSAAKTRRTPRDGFGCTACVDAGHSVAAAVVSAPTAVGNHRDVRLSFYNEHSVKNSRHALIDNGIKLASNEKSANSCRRFYKRK